MSWTAHKRDDSRACEPFVRLTKSSVRFSSALVRAAGAKDATHVVFYVDHDERRLGFRFYAKGDADAYVLTREKSPDARMAQSVLLKRTYPWLVLGRYEVKHSAALWYVEMPK